MVARIEAEEAAAAAAAAQRRQVTPADNQRILAQQQDLKRKCVGSVCAEMGDQLRACGSASPVALLINHHTIKCPSLCRQRDAEAAEERSIQEYMRKRREREAGDAARQANKREAQDRWAGRGRVGRLLAATLCWARILWFGIDTVSRSAS